MPLYDRDAALFFLNEWYPCTALLLGDRAEAAVELFCRDEPAVANLGTAAGGAQHWLTCLQAEIARETGLPEYAEDVAAYEGAAAALAMSDAATLDARFVAEHNASLHEPRTAVLDSLVPIVGRHVRVEHFAFDVPGIVAAIEDCDRLEGLERPAPCIVLLLKSPGQPRPRPLLISNGVQMLLELCDGRRDCAGIVQCLLVKAGSPQGDDFEHGALEAIEMLRARNVLTYREPPAQQGVSDEP